MEVGYNTSSLVLNTLLISFTSSWASASRLLNIESVTEPTSCFSQSISYSSMLQ